MEDQEDFYLILGLQPGLEGGTSATSDAIRKAYRTKALKCHPDKRPDDPLAAAEFQRLQKAYDVLSDEKARKAYDDLLNIRKARLERENQIDSKRRKMMDDLKRREAVVEAQVKEKDEEERAFRRLKEEIARIRAMHSKKGGTFPEPAKSSSATKDPPKKAKGLAPLEKDKMLKVSWLSAKHGGSEYTVNMLNEIFGEYGRVEDIVIRPENASKQSSALVVMGSRAEVIAATKSRCGAISNPLLVVPLVSHTSSMDNKLHATSREVGSDTSKNVGNIVGSAYHDYEDAILKKLQKKAEQLKSNG